MLFFLNTVLLITINVTLACECGIEGAVSRIFRGSKARSNKYPWLAHVRIYPDRKSGQLLQCGGTLIDETHVIIAAHCVSDDNGKVIVPSKIDVFLGRVKAMSDKSNPVSVSSVWMDSRYEDSHLKHDFAILTLSKSVEFSKTVGPICLPNNENNLTKLVITGWGVTFEGSDTASDDLMETEVDFISKKECNERQKSYAMRINGYSEFMRDHIRMADIPETLLCAINKKTHANVCQGDSGGPIMKKGTNGRYYLMGLISGIWGDCGEDTEDVTGLYTRILYYKETIKSIAPNACWQE